MKCSINYIVIVTLLKEITFTYTCDENGIGTGKKIGSENVEYIISESKIIQEKKANYILGYIVATLFDSDTRSGYIRYQGGNDE